jgi:large subunit ribosomal protein L23
MRSAQSIIKRPLLTEKSARLRETGGAASAPAEGDSYSQKVVFEVARDANKIEIRNAVEKLFKVKVARVNTLVMRGKDRRMGRGYAKMQNWKKAMVTLREGHTIDFFAETPNES